MHLALDTMGGDHGPAAAVEGASLAVASGALSAEQIVLVGDQATTEAELERQGVGKERFAVVHAPDILASESPVEAMRRKPRNSVAVGVELLKEGRAQAFVSAGSTGLVVASATLGLTCLEGIRRPGIAVTIRGEHGPFVVIDVGANPQPRAFDLFHYALMGSAYAQTTLGVVAPRVGLMNIGAEDQKGNPLVREARALLTRHQPNFRFVGNVEGTDVFTGVCDVIVCDGFTGNVLLKVSEGCADYVVRAMGRLMAEAGVDGPLREDVVRRLLADVDYSEYGGALLLGVEGIVTICHGRSRAPAICNAIRFASKAVGVDVNAHIVNAARSVAAIP